MTSRKSPQELRDFALYAFKAYQDVLLVAFQKRDLATTTSVLQELSRSLHRYLEKERSNAIRIFDIQIEHATDEAEKTSLRTQKQRFVEQKQAADDIQLAKNQVFFGIAARALELFLADPKKKEEMLPFVRAFLALVPADMQGLTSVYESVVGRNAGDFWGWHWFDFRDDGEAHYVDTYSRPNRLYVVKGLEILGELEEPLLGSLRIKCTENLDFIFSKENAQGIPAMIEQVRADRDRFAAILSEEEIAKNVRATCGCAW
jgi:hypothetical protein